MVSRSIPDPLVAIRAAPLISSTCTLWYAWDQHFFFNIFTRSENHKSSKAILPLYFPTAFRGAVGSVLGLLAVTLSTSITNLYFDRSVLHARGSLRWYLAGAVCSVGHLLFVPFIAPSVKALFEDESGDNSVDSLKEWLRVNLVRTLTVDLAAWGTLAVAVGRTLKC